MNTQSNSILNEYKFILYLKFHFVSVNIFIMTLKFAIQRTKKKKITMIILETLLHEPFYLFPNYLILLIAYPNIIRKKFTNSQKKQ